MEYLSYIEEVIRIYEKSMEFSNDLSTQLEGILKTMNLISIPEMLENQKIQLMGKNENKRHILVESGRKDSIRSNKQVDAFEKKRSKSTEFTLNSKNDIQQFANLNKFNEKLSIESNSDEDSDSDDERDPFDLKGNEFGNNGIDLPKNNSQNLLKSYK